MKDWFPSFSPLKNSHSLQPGFAPGCFFSAQKGLSAKAGKRETVQFMGSMPLQFSREDRKNGQPRRPFYELLMQNA